jgi:hypothetical protein
MSAAVASLPHQDGGLGLPVLTYVLQELSVRVVARWADPNQGLRSEIGQVRLRHHKAPDGLTRASRRPPARATLQASMVGTGLQLHHALETQPRAPDEIQLAVAALQHLLWNGVYCVTSSELLYLYASRLPASENGGLPVNEIPSRELVEACPFGPVRRVLGLDAASGVHRNIGGGVRRLVECP